MCLDIGHTVGNLCLPVPTERLKETLAELCFNEILISINLACLGYNKYVFISRSQAARDTINLTSPEILNKCVLWRHSPGYHILLFH